MGPKKEKKEFNVTIDEVIECIKESPKGSWGKFIARMSFDNGPSDINIRNMNIDTGRISSGISLSDEEVETVTNKFIEMGYGDTKLMKNEVNKRVNRYGGKPFFGSDEDDVVLIDIEDGRCDMNVL